MYRPEERLSFTEFIAYVITHTRDREDGWAGDVPRGRCKNPSATAS